MGVSTGRGWLEIPQRPDFPWSPHDSNDSAFGWAPGGGSRSRWSWLARQIEAGAVLARWVGGGGLEALRAILERSGLAEILASPTLARQTPGAPGPIRALLQLRLSQVRR